ncbi:hypothetical protein [Emticicia sp.]|uniref:hypothetical protein n=1 Tax=Emticicia sp. TaxID=1930953 RepID=UPI00375047AF
MNEWKHEEKEQFYQGSLALTIGLYLVYLGGETAIYLWMNNASKVPGFVYMKVFLCFFGLILLIYAFILLLPIIQLKVSKQKPIVEAIAWEHFKTIEPKLESFAVKTPDKTPVDRPKAQTLTRINKDLIKTNQVTAVLNEEDVTRIKNISNNFSTKQQK